MPNPPLTSLRKRLADIDRSVSHAPTTRQLSIAVHAILKLLDDMELSRIKDFAESIAEVPDATE
jgi:hypothetical protein